MSGSKPAASGRPTEGRRYRHLFDNAPICIFVIDLTARPATILEVNRRAELVYGHAPGALVGLPATCLAPVDAYPAGTTPWQRVRQGQLVTAETVNQRRDGTQFPVRLTAAADPADGRRMIMTVEDMTADKQRRSEADAISGERLRIAQEIHDGVAQTLAGLRFKSALWRQMAAASPAQRTAFAETHAVLTEAIVDLRRAIFALRPVNLAELGFVPALTQLVDDLGDEHQLAARLMLSGPLDTLPAAYEFPLFRMIQEGLTNIGRHAAAVSVLVRLAVDDAGGVAVSVRDNGRGFDSGQLGSAAQAGQFGLRQMRERILNLGGTLDVRSALGYGTELIIALPPRPGEGNYVVD